MKVNALLVCRSQPSLRLLTTALDLLEIAQQSCLSAGEAMEFLVHGHCSAVVIDFDLPGAVQVARMARMVSPQRRPVIFAMIGALTPVGGAFEAGVNFVLYKPLVLDQVTRSLRAGQGFMRPDRRTPRHKLETLVYLQFGVAALPAIMLDLSEHGLALQAPQPLPHVQEVPLRFVLPGTSHLVEATGEVIWADDSGRAGLFFSRTSLASRRHLKTWLAQRGTKQKNAVRALLEPGRTTRRAVNSSH